MSAEAINIENNYIPCNAKVFRVLLSKKRCIDQDNPSVILPGAFFLRPDENSLSVDIATFKTYHSLEEGAKKAAAGFSRTAGVATLHTGKVRDLNVPHHRNIDIVPEPLDDNPDHAGIVGCPHQIDDASIKEAEKIAGDLARLSRRII